MSLRMPLLAAVPAAFAILLAAQASSAAVREPVQQPAVLKMRDTRLANGEYRAAWPTLGKGEPLYLHLAIGPDIGQGCAVEAPHFFFNQATPRPQDEDALQSLAQCLNSPDLRTSKIELVGHADPRGSDAYNMKLARARAAQVASVLEAHGVDSSRITVVSDGKRDAVGNEPQYSFGYDRRVDIKVAAYHDPAGPRDVSAQSEAPKDVAVVTPELPAVQAHGQAVKPAEP